MDANELIDALAASIIREYLSRKGHISTLQQMDEESPRNDLSVSNRQALMKQLRLENLMKKNKEEPNPLRTMLEVMTKYFADRKPKEQMNYGNNLEHSVNKSDAFDSSINFSPQTNEPVNTLALKLMMRPDSAALARIERANRDHLVVDENVEGESLVGDGKSGLISGTALDSSPSFTTQPSSTRPLSSRQRVEAIRSNDDVLSQKRRPFMKPKSTVTSRHSQNSQLYPMSGGDKFADNSRNDMGVTGPCGLSKILSTDTLNFGNKIGKKCLVDEPPPVSFEALLMKGEERANLIQRIGLEKKESQTVKESYRVESSSMNQERQQIKKKSLTKGEERQLNISQAVDLEIGDIDDLECELTHLHPAVSVTPLKPTNFIKTQSTPIDLKTGIALKNLVLGSPSQLYNEEWLLQAFSFCDMADIKYGILQKKGGPCGVLAAVQACVIQEMLFGEDRLLEAKFKNASRPERSTFLAKALSKILWRAGDQSRAVITLPSDTPHLLNSSKFKQDDVTEKLSLYTFTSFEDLSEFLMQSVSQFETDGCPGVILVMYSAILSRKQYLVKGDFDTPETTLIASHGYCTQELVNLLLTGRAVSNIFNDIIQLDSGGVAEPVILKGISGRSDIGLLSLFEHYKSCQVGTYLKTPKFPIWVVCSESHFSVLFSSRRDLVNDWKVERRFDLIYYDGLARQQEEIRLTISTINPSFKAPTSEEDLVPPLENCIRTKWADAEIDWNDYDPIL